MLPDGYYVILTWGGDLGMARITLRDEKAHMTVSEFALHVIGGVRMPGQRELDSELLMTIERDAWRDYAETLHRGVR
jgi:hypothetical protein